MFHAMSWGIPYCATATGSKLVMAGQKVDGESLHRLFEDHGVTFAGGVPTVWLGYVRYLQGAGVKPTTLNRVLIGGTACPASLMETLQDEYRVEVLYGWGMTETSPIATISKPLRKHRASSRAERRSRQVKQGRAVFGVEIGIRDGNNRKLPHDGKAVGDLVVRGPWIARSYYKMPESERVDGWFFTGDVATIDSDGCMQVTDRPKDVIKSGGEWISSIELESLAMAHPEIAEAAVIGVAHPKWDERPLVLAVRRHGSRLKAQDLLAFCEGKIAKWWMPGRCTVRRRASARGDRKSPQDQIARALREPRSHRDKPDQNALSVAEACVRNVEAIMPKVFWGFRKIDFALTAASVVGTFETCPPILRMSVHRDRPEVAVIRSNRRE